MQLLNKIMCSAQMRQLAIDKERSMNKTRQANVTSQGIIIGHKLVITNDKREFLLGSPL